jgi:hypothetical protein
MPCIDRHRGTRSGGCLEMPSCREAGCGGLAVPGMPVGSPGMEGGNEEPYEVILFGSTGQRRYMRFIGETVLG